MNCLLVDCNSNGGVEHQQLDAFPRASSCSRYFPTAQHTAGRGWSECPSHPQAHIQTLDCLVALSCYYSSLHCRVVVPHGTLMLVQALSGGLCGRLQLAFRPSLLRLFCCTIIAAAPFCCWLLLLWAAASAAAEL